MPYFIRLKAACEKIAQDDGKWRDLADFDVIGDLVDELVAAGGLRITDQPDGGLYVDIPFTPETMP